MPLKYLCARCGHEYDHHFDYVVSPGCLCMTCVEPDGKPCDYGHDPEDNEGEPCTCPGFELGD